MPHLLSRVLQRFFPPRSLPCRHERTDQNAWLSAHVPAGRWVPPPCPDDHAIRHRLKQTEGRGKQPLWEGYRDLRGYRRSDMERSAKEVSTFGPPANALAWLVRERRPNLIVEIGTAFGFSGMYWLSGIKSVGEGHLLTFEPNTLWATQAGENLRAVDERFTLVNGKCEDHLDRFLSDGKKIDMALIDAIHSGDFVLPQFDLIARHASPGALVLIDDVNFSDDMEACWRTIVQDERIIAAVHLGRLGIVEIR